MKKMMCSLLIVLFALSISPAQPARRAVPKGGAPGNSSQTVGAAPAGSVFQLGKRTIAIPPPDGFTEAASQLEDVRQRFTVTEDPNLDLLAVHLPSEIFQTLKRGEAAEPDFYTKVSVSKSLREVDVSPVDFSRLTNTFQSQFAQLTNPDGPTMKSILKHLEKGLSELSERETKVTANQIINVGEIEKTANVYSLLLLMNLNIQNDAGSQRGGPLLCGTAFLRVNQKVIFVYAYRQYRTESDVELMRVFTKQWLAKIAAANRVGGS